MRFFLPLMALFSFAGAASAIPSPKALSVLSPVVPQLENLAQNLAQNLEDPFRIRVLELRSPVKSPLKSQGFTLSGSDLRMGPKGFAGFRSFHVKREGQTWFLNDRDSSASLKVFGRTMRIDGSNIRINLKAVPDHLLVEAKSVWAIDVIATLDLETYLRGVLPSEMPAHWPLEALKAQAIAARTFALYRREHRAAGSSFDLDSDVSDQMFRNPLSGDDTNVSLLNVERAVRETRGLTLQDRHRDVFASYFHADCGGQTEEAGNVWGGGSNLGTAVDGGCPLNPRAVWTLKINADLVSKMLANALKRPAGSALTRINSGVRSSSHRLKTVLVAWNDGTTSTVGGNDFRAALGFDQLRSTQFSIERVGGDYIFKGQGYGHGVGLCQWGARQMAKAGRDYREILNHYYPKASLVGAPQKKMEGALAATDDVPAAHRSH